MNPSTEHQRLVKALVTYFASNLKYAILAVDLPEYESKPTRHGRHSPDIVARDQFGTFQLGEAKVGNDIFSQQSQEQIEDFSSRIMTETGKPVILHLVVFRENEQTLINQIKNLGMGYKIGSRIKIWVL
ncbi:hypothetical protein HYT59_01600 [Candidatus Woesebacteria bacterium]|nr:hypothetical protein [Candidatus Woesebacteria bacterium]MBI4037314.1 hypothetical protein [Candidatus Daviesbacteria bacterium]